MSFVLGQEFRTPLVDGEGRVTPPWQQRFARAVVLDAYGVAIASLNGGMRITGQLVAGGLDAPPGSEPLSSVGAGSGVSLADRSGGSNPRWVLFPNSSVLRFWNADDTDCFEVATEATTADGEVCILVRRNVGGVFSVQRVSMGAADSGGTGYKVLRVPN